jgi:hypothetical protein
MNYRPMPLKLTAYRNWFGKAQEVEKIPRGLKLAFLIGRGGAAESRALSRLFVSKPLM